MKKGLIYGIVLVAIGSFTIYWALDHSPNAPLSEKINDLFKEESYRMSETWYYASLIVGTIITLLGLRKLLLK